jgi:lipoprotein-anchoring transpeptidase ErfK/SrfK
MHATESSTSKILVTAMCALVAIAAFAPVLAQEGVAQEMVSEPNGVAQEFSSATTGTDLATADLLQLHAGVDETQLKAGDFVWLPAAQDNSGAPLMIIVNLQSQHAYVYRDGQPIAITTVSTGRPGRETPTGTFEILAKERMHHSNLYDNAPMPFMQRLTWSGLSLHAGKLPGHPASHGCIRLPAKFAEQLYQLTQRGETVVVTDDGSAAALARAGLDTQLSLLAGTAATVHDIVGAVGPAPVESGDSGRGLALDDDGTSSFTR